MTITVASEAGDEAVAYDEGTSVSMSNRHGSYDEDARVYTLAITNTSGYTLPKTGGMGVAPVYLLGLILVAGACAFLALRRCSVD